MTLTVRPLTPDLWPDLEDLFGREGACHGCWCMYWRIGPAYRRRPPRENKALSLRRRRLRHVLQHRLRLGVRARGIPDRRSPHSRQADHAPRPHPLDTISSDRDSVAMISVSVSIDVPNIADAVRFYASAFGFSKCSTPAPGVVVLRAGDAEICLLERRAGTQASSHSHDTRRYERHWTPVHLDIHVDDLAAALAKAVDAGAIREQVFESPEHPSVAFCADPFGHGFCLIERKR